MTNRIGPVDLHHVQLETAAEESVLVATISRPPVNALVSETYSDIAAMCQLAANHPTVAALVLQSRERMFSAGADVTRLAVSGPVAAERRYRLRQAIIELWSCRVPVICAINGAAVGAGAALAAGSDIVVADDDAFVALPEVDIGLVGGASALSRLVPPKKLRSLALTGRRMYARELLQDGAVETIVPSSELHAQALQFAENIANKGYHTARRWKEALAALEKPGLGNELLIEQAHSLNLEELNSTSDNGDQPSAV